MFYAERSIWYDVFGEVETVFSLVAHTHCDNVKECSYTWSWVRTHDAITSYELEEEQLTFYDDNTTVGDMKQVRNRTSLCSQPGWCDDVDRIKNYGLFENCPWQDASSSHAYPARAKASSVEHKSVDTWIAATTVNNNMKGFLWYQPHTFSTPRRKATALDDFDLIAFRTVSEPTRTGSEDRARRLFMLRVEHFQTNAVPFHSNFKHFVEDTNLSQQKLDREHDFNVASLHTEALLSSFQLG